MVPVIPSVRAPPSTMNTLEPAVVAVTLIVPPLNTPLALKFPRTSTSVPDMLSDPPTTVGLVPSTDKVPLCTVTGPPLADRVMPPPPPPLVPPPAVTFRSAALATTIPPFVASMVMLPPAPLLPVGPLVPPVADNEPIIELPLAPPLTENGTLDAVLIVIVPPAP